MNKNTRRMVVCAMLTAMGVVLSGVLSIPIFEMGGYNAKISFGSIPVILSSVLYGPLWGGIVGGVTDFLQAVVFPKGAYNLLFTLTAILAGVIPGLFFYRKQEPTWKRLALAVTVRQIIYSILLNTTILAILQGNAWIALAIPRFILQVIMIPIHTFLVYYIIRFIKKRELV